MIKVFDRVQETSTTTGTGDFTLAGAETGFRSFASVFSVSDETYYTIEDDSGAFEVGRGTYSAADTLTRTEVFSSSNGNNLVDFLAGSKRVFVTYPAGKSVYLEADNTPSSNIATTGKAIAMAIVFG